MQIAVLGAGGQLGREVVAALARKYNVRAVVRRPPVPMLDSAVDIQIADAAIARCVAVVNAISAGTLRRNNVESTTTAVAMAAAKQSCIQRYIAMSAGMVGLDWFIFKHIILRPLIFRHILAEHRHVEEIVRRSGLAWTILQPHKSSANGIRSVTRIATQSVRDFEG